VTDLPHSRAFENPYTALDRPSWRAIAQALRNNALASFPPRAFDDMAVGRSFAGRQQIILNEPEGIRHVLIENAGNYRRTASVGRALGPVVGRGLFLAEGSDWRHQRRMLAPAFAPRMMAPVAAETARACRQAIARLQVHRARPVELFPHLQLLALDVAAATLFSLDITAEGPPLRAAMQLYATGIGRPSMLDFILPRGWPTPRSWARWRFRRAWMRRIARILAQRAQRPASAGERDLFDLMAESGVPHRERVEQAATMLTAGHETTAVALAWAIHLVAAMPDVQQRIADEVATLDLSPVGAIEALPRLAYTRAVIDETLRLYPPAFSLVRQARAADMAAGIAIAPRAVVLIVPWVLHRHRRLWRDADTFDPSRFLPGSEPPARFSYLPFGTGPRACIGAQFALTESTLALASLVQAFRIEPLDHEPLQPVASITLQPDRSPSFRLRPR